MHLKKGQTNGRIRHLKTHHFHFGKCGHSLRRHTPSQHLFVKTSSQQMDLFGGRVVMPTSCTYQSLMTLSKGMKY